MKETKKQILNRLFKENNLTDEDVFKHKFYTIITRNGIDKIMSKNSITFEDDGTAPKLYTPLTLLE